MLLKSLSAILLCGFIFSGCSSPTPIYKLEKEKVSVKLDDGVYYEVPKDKVKVEKFLDSCVIDSAYFKVDDSKYDFALDYIDLQSDCSWTSSSRSEYTKHLLNSNKIASFTFIEKYENDFFDITKYKTDKDCFIYLIGIYRIDGDLFIVDKNGAVASQIVKLLKLDMDINIEKQCSEDTLKLDYSIIRHNFLYKYFKADLKSGDSIELTN